MDQREAFSVPKFASIGFETSPVHIILGGCYTKMYHHEISKRTVNEYVLIFCTDGEGWVELDDHKRQPVKSGQILFLPPGIPHSYGNVPGQYWSLLWFHCIGGGLPFFYHQIHLTTKKDRIVPLTGRTNERLYFERALSILKNAKSLINIIEAEATLTELLCEMANIAQQHTGHLADKHLIESAMKILETTDNYRLSLDELADSFGISKYYFIRLFKRYSDYTPMEYFQRVKLQKACTLLTDSNLSIKKISEFLGYANQYYFSKAFKDMFGLSPSEFKKLL